MKKRPIIVQCARTIHPNGGVSGVAYFLEQEFIKQGYQTERFTIENLPLGVLFRERKIKNIFFAKIYLFLSVCYYSIVGTIFLSFYKKKDRIIICHNDVLIGDIYVNHGLHKSLLEKNGYLKMFLKNPLHLFLYLREEIRFRYGNHKVIITFSKADADELKSLYPIKGSKIIIIPNGIDVNKFFYNKELRKKIRKLYKVENKFIMIFIGHEFERKGLKYIIESLKYLEDNVILFVIGGNESMINKYKQISKKLNLEKRIYFFGYQKTINAFLNAADVMVLASDIEPWGLVGIEAMATATPLISTRTNGPKEYLIDGVNGFFVERDPKDIANKIKTLIDNKNLYQTMCLNARKTAEKYSWNKIVKKYLKIINFLFRKKNV